MRSDMNVYVIFIHTKGKNATPMAAAAAEDLLHFTKKQSHIVAGMAATFKRIHAKEKYFI